MSSTTKRVAGNTAFQIAGKVVSMSITMLATIIITRMYGREGYGAFSLMQNYPALLFIIADFGINAIAVRELSQDWSKARKYFANIVAIRTVIAFLLIALMNLILLFLPYDMPLKIGIFLSLFLILPVALYATTNIIFQTKLRYDLSTIGYLVGYGVILVLILGLSFLKVNVMWVSFGYVIGGLVTVAVNIFYVKRLGVDFGFTFDKKLWKYLFSQALPLGLMFIFSQLNFKADSIALSILKVPAKYGLNNTETVAVYNLPYKVFEVSLVMPTFFMNAVYPVLVKRMQDSKKSLLHTFKKALAALFGVGVGVSLLGFLFAPMVIKFLGGAAFAQSVTVLRILFVGLIVFYMTQPISWLIVTLGKQKYLPWIYLVSAVFDIGANIVFIPKYSFYGSSVITIAAELFILGLLVYAAHKAWRARYAS